MPIASGPMPKGGHKISPMLARTAAGQKILSDISQYDPTFDQTNYGQRFQAAKDFAPQGKTGQAIIQNNTVIEHSAQLLDRARALNNTSIPLLNSGLNVFSEQRGESPVTRFNQQKLRLVDEMAKLLKGGQGSEGEINRQLSVLHAAQSPEQLQSGIEDIIAAAESRKSSQLAQYETAMGRKPTPDLTHAYHNPEAEAASATIKANPLPGSDRYNQMQADAAARLQVGGAPAQGSTAQPAPEQPAAQPDPLAQLKARAAQGDKKAADYLKSVQGARQAPDGNWYVPDPSRGPNKYLRVDSGAGGFRSSNDTPPLGTLKEGHVTTFKNGQKWSLQNGQPVQVP